MEIKTRLENKCYNFVASDERYAKKSIKHGGSIAVFFDDKVVLFIDKIEDFSMNEINKIKSSKYVCGDYQTLKMLGYGDSQIDLGELLITEKRYNDNDSIICKTNEELLQANSICVEAEIANKNDEQDLLNNFRIGKVIVALYNHNNEPCGTARVNFVNGKMIIGGVATTLNYRGKGYGKLALEKVLHTVNSNCYLFVCNPIALNMYKSMGFYTICTWGRIL